MSLILEALKKSEQQRRLGEAPTLGTPVVATRRKRIGNFAQQLRTLAVGKLAQGGPSHMAGVNQGSLQVEPLGTR